MSGLSTTVVANGPLPAGSLYERARISDTRGRQSLSESGKILPQSDVKGAPGVEITPAITDSAVPVSNTGTELQFQISETTSKVIVTVRDAETGDLVRQIPTKETIAIAQYIAESTPGLRRGVRVDESE